MVILLSSYIELFQISRYGALRVFEVGNCSFCVHSIPDLIMTVKYPTLVNLTPASVIPYYQTHQQKKKRCLPLPFPAQTPLFSMLIRFHPSDTSLLFRAVTASHYHCIIKSSRPGIPSFPPQPHGEAFSSCSFSPEFSCSLLLSFEAEFFVLSAGSSSTTFSVFS